MESCDSTSLNTEGNSVIHLFRSSALVDGYSAHQYSQFFNPFPFMYAVCHLLSHMHYIKSHLELQREITLIELAPSPYFFVSSICLAYMNMFARFDENPAMTLRVIKEKALY